MIVDNNKMCCSVAAAATDATHEAALEQPKKRLMLPTKTPQRQRFMAKKCLGRGAQATVYSAHVDADLAEGEVRESFAIKVFNSSAIMASTPEDLALEAHTHELLIGHPNIMQLHGSYIARDSAPIVRVPRSIPRNEQDRFAKWREGHEQLEGHPVMVFEECRYGDLFNFVSAHGALRDYKLLKYLFLQICSGLHALHTQASLCHRDIKLENILVSDDGVLKLCDFGMVQPVDIESSKRQGTEMYMAPEV